MTTRIAALLASHNRVSQTLSCLEALQQQDGADASVDIVLCDAGSTDGTARKVRARFPSAVVLEEGPELYWSSGMRRAFEHAVRADYDFYLWLNDDTILDREALAQLLKTHASPQTRRRHPAVIVGAVRDPITGVLTYGGVARPYRHRPLRFAPVPPQAEPVQVEAMNGNCVLIPRDVVSRIGVLDPGFSHAMGDFDYGLRARAAGASIWVAPGTVGTCARNPATAPAASFREHVAGMSSPKGLPFREWARFARRWTGPAWPVYAVSPFVRRTLIWARAHAQRR
jgi:GT2 family glycosyltransferase